MPATATPPRTNGQAGASATAKAPSAVRPRAPQTNGRAATRESRPRPAVIVQDDNFSATYSVALCPLTKLSHAIIVFLGLAPFTRS